MPTSKPILVGNKPRLSPLAWLILGLIKLYRLFLSPLMSMFAQCRFHPTCSQYGLDAVAKYGAMRGGWMTIKRIVRCNPFFPGGFDPVE